MQKINIEGIERDIQNDSNLNYWNTIKVKIVRIDKCNLRDHRNYSVIYFAII